MQVKICGLTKKEEATYLNDVGADYAGFVFYSKSKRNVSFAQSKEIREQLNPQIQAVAVTVSPDRNMIKKIINSGFDVIQVHGELTKEALDTCMVCSKYHKGRRVTAKSKDIYGNATALTGKSRGHRCGRSILWRR